MAVSLLDFAHDAYKRIAKQIWTGRSAIHRVHVQLSKDYFAASRILSTHEHFCESLIALRNWTKQQQPERVIMTRHGTQMRY